MRISIFGLGYVGAVCAASLAARGHQLVGVDVSESKVTLINAGKSPIVEPGLAELIASAVSKGHLRATRDFEQAIYDSELTMVCVGTPSKSNGDLDLSYIEDVCKQIGLIIKSKTGRHTVVIRSTVLPGTVNNFVVPILEEYSGKKAGESFGVAVNPEFLRESTAIQDYDFPPITVIGEYDRASGDLLEELYQDLPAPIIRKSIAVAELIKYTCNVWHATKVSFANEIGNIAKAAGVDGREVMDVVCQDNKLNISRYYMRPGFAFGGSCLPKDVRALTYRASQWDLKSPLLNSIMSSNSYQIDKTLAMIEKTGKRKVAMLGLSFKAGTDDLRESPLVELAERLLGKGYHLNIYDRNVDYARVNGANREYINHRIPHLAALLKVDLMAVVDQAEVVIIGNGDDLFETVIHNLPAGKKLIDLVGFMKTPSSEFMEGICW